MNKKYQVIYADPPWDYGKPQHAGEGKSPTTGATTHYPTMKVKDMIPHFQPQIDEWADEDCILFMWTSNPHLAQAIQLGEGWGFKYATVGFVWYKQKTNPGSYTMSQCELCLVFKKGKIPRPRGARNVRQLVSEERREHSRKPDEVRKRIELMFPNQNKIEMFAREKSKGWEVFGNQVELFNNENKTV